MIYIPLSEGSQYVPGIYCIESVCGKVYIGSAVTLRTRFMTHRRAFEIGKHDNARLQNYYNKYGSSSLSFRVLEYCSKEKLIEREQHYIDTLTPFFNIARIAGATYGLKPWLGKKHTAVTKAKISAANLETFSKRPKKKKPARLTKEQNIQRFAELNKTPEGRKRCREINLGNKYWLGKKHKPETIANRIGALNGRARKVFCVELNREFSHCKEATDFLGVSKSTLSNSLIRGTKIFGKYTFKYVDNGKEQIHRKP